MRRRFRRVLIAGVALVAYDRFGRTRMLHWGATTGEVDSRLPGDQAGVSCSFDSTRAITIDAPPAAVWPWIVQIGDRRGGFYSYDWVERLMLGGHYLEGHSATRIHPELQHLAVGDFIALGGTLAANLPVTAVEPGRLLRLGDGWTFVLEELPASRTRLIVRMRGDGLVRASVPARFRLLRGAASVVDYLISEPLDFVMVRKMLLGIRSRAEVLSRSSAQHDEPVLADGGQRRDSEAALRAEPSSRMG